MDNLKLEKYFERIHYSGDRKVNMENVKQIHQLHPKFIPFENIDSYTGTVPSLNTEDIFQKLIIDSRGGYCYEQNLLLHEVLKSMGFNVNLRLGRVVWTREESSSAARTHLLLTVNLDDQIYLIDCGFGTATLTSPLLLHNEEPQQTPNGLFKISKNNSSYTLWTWREKWLPVYRFSLDDVELPELEIANWYLSTHPDSGFKNNLILSKVDEDRRYTFSVNTLNIRKNTGEKESVQIEDDIELYQMLQDIFGLKENAVEILKQKKNK
ncbi:arylamine N-acetyltransferase family protein [Chryseobacterium artocarpi]|uniref:arylamine N-acetyltransferase family protein n=1 Tax=Chryseobacterium artocarpi TaxID=1414727 RepID=UPI003F2CAC17